MVPSTRRTSRLLSAAAFVAALLATAALLAPEPLADVFFGGIVLLNPLFATIGAAGAWTNRASLIWLAALLSAGLTLAGMMSIGTVLAPTAILLLGSAVAASAAGPRAGVRERIVADPPSARDRLLRVTTGVAAAVAGAGLVDAGAFDRELFGSCARETLACALETTNWGAVGLTLLGLGAVAGGGWLLWKQVYVSRVLRRARAS